PAVAGRRRARARARLTHRDRRSGHAVSPVPAGPRSARRGRGPRQASGPAPAPIPPAATPPTTTRNHPPEPWSEPPGGRRPPPSRGSLDLGQGIPAGAYATLTPTPTTSQSTIPSAAADASSRTPETFAPATSTSLGHFSDAVFPAGRNSASASASATPVAKLT